MVNIPYREETLKVERIYLTLRRTPLAVARKPRNVARLQKWVSAWAERQGYVASSISLLNDGISSLEYVKGVTVAPTRIRARAIPMGSHGITRERLDKISPGIGAIKYPVIDDAG